MMMITKIFNYLRTPKGQRNLLIVALIVAIIFLRGCGSGVSETDVTMYKQNISALKDSVRTYKTRNGDLVFEKSSLLVESGDLKKYNKDLAKELKDIKDNPIYVAKIVTKLVHDTMYLEPKVDTAGITFNADSTVKSIPFTWGDTAIYAPDNYRQLAGKYIISVETNLNVTTKNFSITNDELGFSLTTGLTENKDDLLEIFIKSPYPGFKPSKIDGALINPRESDVIKKFFPPKRWSIGPYVGYGGYVDPSKGTAGTGINAGVSISYGVFQWGKK